MALAHINDKKINLNPLLIESPFKQASKEAPLMRYINKGVFNVVTTSQHSKVQTVIERDHGVGVSRGARQSAPAADGQQGKHHDWADHRSHLSQSWQFA